MSESNRKASLLGTPSVPVASYSCSPWKIVTPPEGAAFKNTHADGVCVCVCQGVMTTGKCLE